MIKLVFIKLKLIVKQIFYVLKRLYIEKNYKVVIPDHLFYETFPSFKAYYLGQIKLQSQMRLGRYVAIEHFNRQGKVEIGKKFTMRSFGLIRVEGGRLKIGEEVIFNNGSSVNCLYDIEIGDRVMFGENVRLYDHNHKYEIGQNGLYTHPNDFTMAKITVEDHCWIGSNVTILKGVTIGKNSIIGAGCVIYKSIPENSIVVNRQGLDIKTQNIK